MLILTRKLGESITIGDDIKVSVLGIRGRQVRLGIEAPSKVVVHREEIYVKIQQENRNAQGGPKNDLSGLINFVKKVGRVKPPEGGTVEYRDHPRERNGQSGDNDRADSDR